MSPTFLRFEPSIQGKIQEKTIYIKSNFMHPIKIKKIMTYDPLFSVEKKNFVILPKKKFEIANIIFDSTKTNVNYFIIFSNNN